ncbi:hypothetical protein [Gluconobacter oxydans]|uniref:Uncharacterized protein n=1 Tax=Gluconobacter oxydans TaxID=442 RepID=A0AB35ARG5_GLUOY|nr:hypothetical protein [Gluconobacter oxydans]MBF0856541.1 hypothetical protein [Gluconobacter oxydans]TCW25575.1 hypothetical protein EDC20_11344 [Gluconobacter oxydans]
MSDHEGSQSQTSSEGSVVDQILEAFLTKVEAEPLMLEVAKQLRNTLLVDREDSETQLKRALSIGEEV